MKRRELFKNIGLTAGAVTLSGVTLIVTVAEQKGKRKKVLRIAHITHVHICPKYDAPNRFRKCLEEIKKYKVDFFLNGGDTIYAADYNNITRERVNEPWNIWKELRNKYNDYEVHSCLGNQDMWWAAPDKQDAMYPSGQIIIEGKQSQFNVPTPTDTQYPDALSLSASISSRKEIFLPKKW